MRHPGRATPNRPSDRIIVRAMWADPLWQPDQYAPTPENPPQPTAYTSQQPDRTPAPVAVIHLPNEGKHLVYPPRERIGFRRA